VGIETTYKIANLYKDDEVNHLNSSISNDVVDYAYSSQDDLVRPDSEAIGNKNVVVNSMYEDIDYAAAMQGDITGVYNTMEEHSGTVEMVDDELMLTRMIHENVPATAHVDVDNNLIGTMMESDDIDNIVALDN